MNEIYLKIENVKLWARVGVLDKERELGQLFSLNIFLWSNFEDCIKKDDLNETIDYSILIDDIKKYTENYSCLTIEKYSDNIMKLVKEKFNPNKLKIVLTKCTPPINGFDGQVSIVNIYNKCEK